MRGDFDGPNCLEWSCAFLLFLVRTGTLVPTIRTVYPLLVGRRDVVGWRRWIANHAYVFRPWRSRYLRWRMHTVFATDDAALSGPEFRRVVWENREQFVAWVRWSRDMSAPRPCHAQPPGGLSDRNRPGSC